MLFSSLTFIYVFLAAVLPIYFICPKRFKNHVLLISSLIFYLFGEPICVLLLILTSVSGWLHSLFIERRRGTRAAKAALVSSIIINVVLLGFFKYADFFIGTVNALLGTDIPLLHIPLPIGISFFTFQTMSYTIDVYRGDAHAQRNLATLTTFVCLFPQLIAGPIVRYTDVDAELQERSSTVDGVASGISRFAVGLGKKVLLANLMGELCSTFQVSDERSVLFHWLYAVAFTLQIYFDFSGYSDMAVGMGRMFGFKFPENFNYPFIAKTVSEFWRRWHMTLSTWFRDYVYIPLGGNRVSKLKWVRNIAVVWLLTGFWHGAQWNFVVWGGFFGVLLLLERFVLGGALKKLPAVISHMYVMFLVVLSFVIFNASSMAGAVRDLGGMFGAGNIPLVGEESFYCLKSYCIPILIGIIGSTPLPKILWQKLKNGPKAVLEPVGMAAVILVSTAFIISGSFNPFLYFRF